MSSQIDNQQQNQQNNQSSEISVRESLRILDNEKEFLKAFDAGTLDQKIRQKMIKEDMLRVELDGEKVSVDKKKEDINKVKWYEVAVGILTLGIGGAIVHHFRKKSDHKDLEAEIQGEMDKVRNAIRTELSAMDEKDQKNIVDMVKKDTAKCFKEFMQNNNNAMFEILKDKINKGEINDKEFKQITNNLFNAIQSLDSGKGIDDNLKNYINAISGDTPVQTAQADVQQAKPNPVLLQNYRQENDLTLIKNPQSLLTAVQERINKNQDVVVDKAQLNNVLKINDVNKVQFFSNNPNVKFNVKQQIEDNKFVVGPVGPFR